MGQTEINSALINVPKVSLNNFNIQEKIGQGGLSKVYKAEYIKTGHTVAIKQMNKLKLTQKQMIPNILKEKQILSSLYHPFIVNMYASFQDNEHFYVVMDYCSNSDFRNQLQYIKNINEAHIKFFAGCIILGLEYIHSQGIIHRDIKPENIICDDKGFLRISDFGIAKSIYDIDVTESGRYEVCGTPGFISPEIIEGKKIGVESDYYSLGVMLYEIILGRKPYASSSSSKNEIIYDKVILTQQETGEQYSKTLCDFISKLIERNPKKRLGKNGIHELKSHSFFDDFNWKQLFYKTMKTPYIPHRFLKRRNSTSKLKTRIKSTISKESKETNDSDESIHNTNNEYSEFDYLRTPKLNCFTTFYNPKLIQYSTNLNNSNSNIKLTKNSKKQISLISPCKLMFSKHSPSKHIQLYHKKCEYNNGMISNNNHSFNKPITRASSVSRGNICNLPSISKGKDSFSKKESQTKLITNTKGDCKPKTAFNVRIDMNGVQKERLNSAIKGFRFNNSDNNKALKMKMFRKINNKKKSYISNEGNGLNLSSFIMNVKDD